MGPPASPIEEEGELRPTEEGVGNAVTRRHRRGERRREGGGARLAGARGAGRRGAARTGRSGAGNDKRAKGATGRG